MPLSAFDIEIIHEIQKFIIADLQVHYSIGYLAEKAGMSESRLKESFKLVVKTSLYAYLKQKRIELAATLLEGGDRTLQQISKQTGFKHYSNFTRAFKKHYGKTPGSYRAAYKK